MKCQLDSACISHIGTVRKTNEDNIFFNGTYLEKDNIGTRNILTDTVSCRQGAIYAVFDGMGGESSGEWASFLAAAQMYKAASKRLSINEIKEFLLSYAHQANERICETMRVENISRMGTTAAIVYIKNNEATIMNIGDSRVYLLGEEGIEILSVDHTDVKLMQQSGISRPPKLTQHLGIFPEEMIIEPHIISTQISEGNRMMICSDGLYNALSKDDIRELMGLETVASETVDLMVNEALQKGSKDNITVIVIDIKREKCSLKGKNHGQ